MEAVRSEVLYRVVSNVDGQVLITGDQTSIDNLIKRTTAYNKNPKNIYKQSRTLTVKNYDTDEVVSIHDCK